MQTSNYSSRRRMLQGMLTVMFMLLASAHTAFATQRTFVMSGTIENSGISGVLVGDPFVATLSYDDAQAPFNTGLNFAQYSSFTYSLTVSSLTFTKQANQFLQVSNETPDDLFADGTTFPRLSLFLSDFAGTTFNSTDLPASLSLSDFEDKFVVWKATAADEFIGEITSITTCVTDPIVTTNLDNGPGSLRQAVIDACPGSTITFAGSVTSPISLSGGQIVIDKNLTIQGPGANLLTVQNTAVDSRVFYVGNVAATISGLTISGGELNAPFDPQPDDARVRGGGIFNSGQLNVTNCTISNNHTHSVPSVELYGAGDGIYNNGTLWVTSSLITNNTGIYGSFGGGFGGGIANDGVAWVTNSTVSNNHEYIGGGISNGLQGQLTVTNSTVSNNNADLFGGGIYNTGNVAVKGDVTVTHSTVSANNANNGAGIYSDGDLAVTNSTVSGNVGVRGGGIQTSFGVVNLTNATVTNNSATFDGGGIFNDSYDSNHQPTVNSGNSIIAGNSAANVPATADYGFETDGVPPQDYGDITSLGYNLFGKVDAPFNVGMNGTGDQLGSTASPIDPLLGPLANNGGPTHTHALLPGPAIDKGSAVAGLTTDQRGETRSYDNPSIPNASGGDGSDIGAYEAGPLPDLSINDVTQNELNSGTSNFTFTVSLSVPAGAGGVTFDIATTDGTAQDDNPTSEDNDYIALALTGQSIAAGNSSKMFSVTVNGDLAVESNETFFINVTNVTGANLGDGQGQGTITNDDVAATPEMDVQGNSTSITDGDLIPGAGDDTDFGSVDVASGFVSHTFSIQNTGGADLNLSGTPKVQIGGAHPADFTVTLQPSSPVSGGNFTLFVIKFDPSALGSRTATVSIENNDSNENPYDFAIQGMGVNTITITGSGGGGACLADNAILVEAGSCNGKPRYACNQPGGTCGALLKQITWDGSQWVLGFIQSACLTDCDWTNAANTATPPSTGWVSCGTCTGTLTLSGDVSTLSPEIAVSGNSMNIADGDNTPSATDDTDFGSADITSGSVDRVFTIANLGNANLNLTGAPKVQITGAADFSVMIQPSSPVAATSGTTTFTVHFDPSATGLRSATISIDNDDADENLYDFAIQGTGTTPNTAPVNAVPGLQATNENTPLVFSSSNGNPISISDVDAGGAQVQVTLTATNGTITLALTTGLVFITGDGTADATMTFTGTISNINAALNGLSFAPTANFNGPASLQIVTNDLGNTGSGGPLSDDDTVNITVNAPVKAFVFLANKITLKRTKQDTPEGDIHSNGTLTVEKGDPSTYESNLTAVGKITIQKDNTINGNVTSQTSISNSGTINGTPSVEPVDTEALPSLGYSAGGLNKTVPSGGSLSLAPGSYGIVTINSGGTLKLASGEYFMTELRALSSETVIEIDLTSGDEVVINVVSNLQLGKEAAIQLLPNGEGDSEKVTFNTLQSTAVNFGKEAYLLGSFNAPNAKVTLVKNSQLRGSICANEILVERDCLFLHHDATGSLPGPGNLPKTFEEEVASDQSPVTSYELEQNYPNPFNPSTAISFQLPVTGEVSLSIFNSNGQLVKRLVAGQLNAGQHSFMWDATNERGERVASGVYLYVIKAGEFTAQRKLVLMK